MKKIAIIVGTRPEAIKLMPVYLELKKSNILEPVLISTGQHKEMLKQILSFFEIVPDYELNLMTAGQSLASLSSLLFSNLDGMIATLKPDLIIVQGDTSSAMVGGMIGYYHQIKVAHVEAGLRTYDKFSPFPEEINRRIIGLVADFHFAPTAQSLSILQKEEIKNCFNVGNTVIDSLMYGVEKVRKNAKMYKELFQTILLEDRKNILVTSHRRESFGDEFQNICTALKEIARKYPEVNLIYPVHLNPNIKLIVDEELSGIQNIQLISPIPYNELLFLMENSYMILTDSGGIQEEAPSLDKPIIVLRKKTERPEGISAGCAVLAGTDSQEIVRVFDSIYTNADVYAKMAAVINPYGDGKTAQRIRKIIEKNFSDTE